MDDLHIAPERDKPEVDFKFSQHRLALRGESFPENAVSFYAPVVASLMSYLAVTRGQDICVDFELRYFNSSSTKIILNIFRILDQASSQDNKVHVNWRYDAEDDTVAEFGNEIASDFLTLDFQAVPLESV